MRSTILYFSGLLLIATGMLSAAAQETPETVYAKIGDLLKAGHADKIVPLMTKAAHKEMLNASIETAAEGYLLNKDDAKPLPDGTKPTGADLGFDKFEFPKWFSTPGELPEPGFSMRDFRKRLQALIDKVPDHKRALNSMHSYATAADPKGSFSGKIIEPPKGFEGGAGTLWVSFVEIYGTFNHALKFEKQKDGTLLYAGNDWELTKAYEKRFIQYENLTISGPTIEDKIVSLEDLKGKVVLIDFWGTWWGGCIAAFPQLKKLKKTYEPHGFEIIGVASDKKEDLNKFFKKNGELPWLTIVDTKSAIAERLKIDVMPTYLVVDKNGKHIASPRDKEELGELIAKLLSIAPIPLEELKK